MKSQTSKGITLNLKQMKKIAFPMFAMVIAIFVVSCAPKVTTSLSTKYVKISPPIGDKPFTNEQVVDDIKKTDRPTVVVRASSVCYQRINDLLERGLLNNKFDVRDRNVFENVIKSISSANQTLDYQMLYEKTQTQLMLEVTYCSFDDEYEVTTYIQDGVEKPFFHYEYVTNPAKPKKKMYREVKDTYVFTGMSIEIKVISLKDNLIGGIYKYYYTPCSEADGGCEITYMPQPNALGMITESGFTYRGTDKKEIGAIGNQNSGNSQLRESSNDKLSKTVEDYIAKTIVPDVLKKLQGK